MKIFFNILLLFFAQSIVAQTDSIIRGKIIVETNDTDGVTIVNLTNKNTTISENGNENSLVLHLQYGKITMLFTGDLENTGEELLAERIKNLRKKGELPACYDLLKVGHHGSRNATGEELLEVIRPRAAFCSSGKENRYGHPHAETLERLAKWGVSLYNTKDRGAVSMYTDGREYGIQSP